MKFNVSLEKQKELEERMRKLNIFERDIQEKFVRSAGKGGQNINKVSTCVFLKHVPTGIEIKCQQERSQALNRFLARRLLVSKIEEVVLGKKSEKQLEIEKIRKQKRKRASRARRKIRKNCNAGLQ